MRKARPLVVLLMLTTLTSCDPGGQPSPDSPSIDPAADQLASLCPPPSQTTTILEADGAILETWTLPSDELAVSTALPDDSALLSYRRAIERDGADVRRPVADPPVIRTEEEREVWRNEYFNNDLIFIEGVGTIEPITCLDALLFARQANRISQIDQPTEFIASVLRRERTPGSPLMVVFGAGSETFPPRKVYGFEVVEGLVADGWSYWYAIHNHTIQQHGDRIALGVPGPSTSDVDLYRSLVDNLGLEFARVTNGFYTFIATADDLQLFRGRP